MFERNDLSFSSQHWAPILLCLLGILCFAMKCLAEDGTEKKEISAEAGRTVRIITDDKESAVDQGPDIDVKREIDGILAGMTTQEKVAQLFFISPEALTGVNGVTVAGSATEEAYSAWPVGGIIYMEPNIQSWDQTSQMLESIQKISLNRTGLPLFLAVDEEGGRVCRVSGRLENIPYISDMSSVGSTGEPSQAYETGKMIGEYLNQLGFNVDFAPVADVLTNPANTVIGSRSFGAEPQLAADMVSQEVQGLREQGVCATLKHFPGHGNTGEDSHQGLAVSYKTLEELRSCEFLPFVSGISAGAEFIMAGHIAMPNITGNDVPASLSYMLLTEILRNDLGFDGIIITDALNMGAIVNAHDSGEAALLAFQAGADMILMPGDFYTAYSAILEAVESGIITEERLDTSLCRIMRLKLKLKDFLTGREISKDNGQQDKQAIQVIPYSQENVSVEAGFDGVIVEE